MVGLLSLSNELLVQVFSSSDTIESAASLSSATKTLHSLWVEHNNQILTNILSARIIDYEAAVELAILEEIWAKANVQLASSTSFRPPVRLYVAQLLHNAKLATSATVALKACYEDEYPEKYNPSRPAIPACHVAYYQMRKIVLMRLHPEAELQHVIHSTISDCSSAAIWGLALVSMFLQDDESRWREAYVKHRDQYRWGEAEEEDRPLRQEYAIFHESILANHVPYVHLAIDHRLDDVAGIVKQWEASQEKLHGAGNAAV
jgi:hypothetical protein